MSSPSEGNLLLPPPPPRPTPPHPTFFSPSHLLPSRVTKSLPVIERLRVRIPVRATLFSFPLFSVSGMWTRYLVLRMKRKHEVRCTTGVPHVKDPTATDKKTLSWQNSVETSPPTLGLLFKAEWRDCRSWFSPAKATSISHEKIPRVDTK